MGWMTTVKRRRARLGQRDWRIEGLSAPRVRPDHFVMLPKRHKLLQHTTRFGCHGPVERRGDTVRAMYVDDGRMTGRGKCAGWRALITNLGTVDQIVLTNAGDLPGKQVTDLLKTLGIPRDLASACTSTLKASTPAAPVSPCSTSSPPIGGPGSRGHSWRAGKGCRRGEAHWLTHCAGRCRRPYPKGSGRWSRHPPDGTPVQCQSGKRHQHSPRYDG